MAGGKSVTNDSNFYLYAGPENCYWHMTPSAWRSNAYGACGMTFESFGVVPVISLEADAIIDGSGTTIDPFVVE